ncbi:cyclin-like protein [Entophlyctis helioformis]|nr:cyclin-like protein [Entophlyctis helioformis]
MRTKGCSYIFLVGYAMKIPQPTIASACMLFHRFYLRNSFKEYNFHDVAAACLFIACKVEETPHKMQELIMQCARKATKNDNFALKATSKDYYRWRDTIVYHEEIVLASLCYDMDLPRPYDRLLDLSRTMDATKRATQTAWCISNDSLRTTMCLRYTSDEIAVACLVLASRLVSEELPVHATHKTIYDVSGCDYDKVQGMVQEIADMYALQAAAVRVECDSCVCLSCLTLLSHAVVSRCLAQAQAKHAKQARHAKQPKRSPELLSDNDGGSSPPPPATLDNADKAHGLHGGDVDPLAALALAPSTRTWTRTWRGRGSSSSQQHQQHQQPTSARTAKSPRPSLLPPWSRDGPVCTTPLPPPCSISVACRCCGSLAYTSTHTHTHTHQHPIKHGSRGSRLGGRSRRRLRLFGSGSCASPVVVWPGWCGWSVRCLRCLGCHAIQCRWVSCLCLCLCMCRANCRRSLCQCHSQWHTC